MSAPVSQEPAIVVGHLDYRERDRIVRLLTPGLGRVSCLARNARGSRRRFGGALDIGNKVQAGLRPGRGDLWHVDEAELLEGRSGARQDLLRLTLLAYACELCGGLAREHQPEPRLFGLLDMTALLLDAMSGPPGAAFRAGLEAKALTFAGLAPALDRCVACGELLLPGQPVALDVHKGGALHLSCAPGLPALDPTWLLAVEHARRTPLRELVDAPLPPGPAWALAEAVEAWLGRPLLSRRVLAPLEAAREGSRPEAPDARRPRDAG